MICYKINTIFNVNIKIENTFPVLYISNRNILLIKLIPVYLNFSFRDRDFELLDNLVNISAQKQL